MEFANDSHNVLAPHSRRRLVLIGIAACTVVLLGSTAVVRIKANSSWQTMVERGAHLRSAWDARPTTRTPLWGDATDGNAFAHYREAAESMAWAQQDRRLPELLDMNDAEATAQSNELRPQWQQSVQALQTGTRARTIRDEHPTPGSDISLNLMEYRPIINAAQLEAKILRHEGNHRGSVQLTLDAMTMASDIFREGVLINQIVGVIFLAIAIEAWPDEAIQQLDADSTAVFAKGLATLDAHIPTTLNMDRELLFMIENVQHFPDVGDWCGTGTWNYGFSQRWMLADAFLHAGSLYNRFESSPAKTHAAREILHQQLIDEATASGNHAIACVFPNLLSAEATIRDVVAQIRMLRIAIDLHRGLPATPLPDPHANAPLTIQPNPNGFLLSSIGRSPTNPLTRTIAKP